MEILSERKHIRQGHDVTGLRSSRLKTDRCRQTLWSLICAAAAAAVAVARCRAALLDDAEQREPLALVRSRAFRSRALQPLPPAA